MTKPRSHAFSPKAGMRRAASREVETDDLRAEGQSDAWYGSVGGNLRTRDTDDTLLVISQGLPTHARKSAKGKLVACNETGDRIGEGHANARLTDAQVEAIRDRFEAHAVGDPRHEGYRVLSRAFGVSKRTIRDIVDYRRRNVWPAGWKRIDK